jgi:hypothetical protein
VKPVIHVKRPQQTRLTPGVAAARSRRPAGLRFQAAFLDFGTQTIYPSRHPDGRLAAYHLLDGLPATVVVDRTFSGRVVAVKASLIEGYVRDGYFYTRATAARMVAEWSGREEFQE